MPPDPDGARILVVDDSRAMRNIQKNVLAQLGYDFVLEAADGEEALSLASTFRPDLILLNWNMPKMDGLTFLKRFRESDKNTPVIMVTTEATRSRVIQAIRAGVSGYVVKPFTPELLAARIADALGRDAA